MRNNTIGAARLVGGMAMILVAAPCFAAGSDAPPACTVKVAYIVPESGNLALLGRMTPWVLKHKMEAIHAATGVAVGERTCALAVSILDSKSTVAGSAEATTHAILDDKVDVVIAQGAPETTNAASDLCERYAVPCITTTTAIEAWLFGPDGKPKTYRDSFAFFLSVPDLVRNDIGVIKRLPNFNGKIGYLYPSNSDGTVFVSIFDPAFRKEGWSPVDPGRFEAGLPDFSAVVNTFKRQHVQVVAGILDPPDLQNYLQQAAQSGFKPRMTIISKGTGYADAIAAIGQPAAGVLGVNFWSPAFPGKSAFGGWTGQHFVDAYEKEEAPAYYAPTGAYDDAALDILLDALRRAASPDRKSILAAIGSTDLDTIVGPVKFNAQHYSAQPLGMAQWHQDSKTRRWVKENVDDGVYPSVKKTADLKIFAQP